MSPICGVAKESDQKHNVSRNRNDLRFLTSPSSSYSCLSQDLLAVQFSGEVDSIRSGVVLLERSTIDSLRSENEVSSPHFPLVLYVIMALIQGLRAQIRKLHENLKV